MTREIADHLARADELLGVARENLENGHGADSIIRSYYAIFHAASALLMVFDVERSSHHALWSAFGEQITAPGLLDRKYHRFALDLFYQRTQADYLALPESSVKDAATSLERATEFVSACRDFIKNRPTGA